MTIESDSSNLRKRKKNILLLCAATSVYALNLIALGPVVARLADERGLSTSQTGLIFTIHFLGFIVFSLAGAFIADRIGKKQLIVWSLFGFCVGFLLFSAVNNFIIECLIMFVLGGCGGIVECLGSAFAADLDKDNPEYAVNYLQIFFSVGAMVSPLIVSIFLSELTYWKSFYILLAVYSLLLAVMMIQSGKGQPNDILPQHIRLKDLSHIIREPYFLLMCLCMLAYTGSEVGAWGWLSSLLQQKFSFSEIQSGFGVSLFWLFMTIGRLVNAWLIPKLGARRLVILLAGFSAVVTLAIVYITDKRILLLLVAGIGLGCSSQFPLIAGIGSRKTNLPSGTAFTILMVSGNVGSSMIPYMIGVTGDAFGLDKALLIPVILFVLISAAFLFTRQKDVGILPVKLP